MPLKTVRYLTGALCIPPAAALDREKEGPRPALIAFLKRTGK